MVMFLTRHMVCSQLENRPVPHPYLSHLPRCLLTRTWGSQPKQSHRAGTSPRLEIYTVPKLFQFSGAEGTVKFNNNKK